MYYNPITKEKIVFSLYKYFIIVKSEIIVALGTIPLPSTIRLV